MTLSVYPVCVVVVSLAARMSGSRSIGRRWRCLSVRRRMARPPPRSACSRSCSHLGHVRLRPRLPPRRPEGALPPSGRIRARQRWRRRACPRRGTDPQLQRWNRRRQRMQRHPLRATRAGWDSRARGTRPRAPRRPRRFSSRRLAERWHRRAPRCHHARMRSMSWRRPPRRPRRRRLCRPHPRR